MRLLLAPLAVAVLVCGARPASAASIGYDYTAIVTSVTDMPGVAVGDTVYGTMSYFTSPLYVDHYPTDPTRGFYGYPAESLSIHFGSYVVEGRAGRIEIWDRAADFFSVVHDSVRHDTPWLRPYALFQLMGSPGNFTSDALPLDLGQLSDWSTRRLSLGFMFGPSFQAEITSLSVPEPTTVLLVASGLGAWRRRRRSA